MIIQGQFDTLHRYLQLAFIDTSCATVFMILSAADIAVSINREFLYFLVYGHSFKD